jgi:hypothetical protein
MAPPEIEMRLASEWSIDVSPDDLAKAALGLGQLIRIRRPPDELLQMEFSQPQSGDTDGG